MNAQTYLRLDRDDRIIEVGGGWTRFADENGAGPDFTARLLGTNFFDHIAGHFTKRFLRDFLAGVRVGGGQARRRYRCDSPSAKRLMEMHAIAEADGGVRIEHQLLEETPLAFPVAIEQAPSRTCASHLRCSLCNRLRNKRGGAWREPEQAISPAAPLNLVIHTVCADCKAGMALKGLSTESGS